MGNNFSVVIECPFFSTCEKLLIRCECGTIRFPRGIDTRRYIEEHCGNINGYKRCSLHKNRDEYYAEIYEREKN